MTILELKADIRYARLSPQEKIFITALCENGCDKTAAGQKAWPEAKLASVQSMAGRAMKKPPIAALASEFFGNDLEDERMSREDVLCMAARRAKKTANDADAFKFLSLIADIEGWKKKQEPAPIPTGGESIEDKIKELEK